MASTFKNYSLGVPEHSGQRITNETGDTFTGVYEFKDKEREPFFRLFESGKERLDYKEIRTIWHSSMQARFLRQDDKFKHEQHYTAKEGTQRRQADLIYDDRIVIELQHSNISIKDLKARTEDALETYDKIIWIFDFEQMKAKLFQTDRLFDSIDKKLVKALSYKQQKWVDTEGGIYSTRLPDSIRDQYFTYDSWPSVSYGWLGCHEVTLQKEVDITGIYNRLVRFRHTKPPAWAHLVAEVNDSHLNGYDIKQYGEYDITEPEVEIWFHVYDQENEYESFFKFVRGLSRSEAKRYAVDLQKRYAYMLEFATMGWDQSVENIKSG